MNLSSSLALPPSTWHNKTFAPDLEDGIHIWAVELRQSPEYQKQLHDWLSDREKTKAQRMLVSLKRDHQIQARAWLRWFLAKYTQTTPENINYSYGSLGKPYLESERQVFFNATDSGTALLCAFSKSSELGIDVESTPRKVSYSRIAEKKFTKQEQTAIKSAPDSAQSNAFLGLWTRKEAFGKALGVGIRYRMNQFNLCDDLNSYKYRITDDNGSDWFLSQFAYKNNIACLVSQQQCKNISFYHLNVDALNLADE